MIGTGASKPIVGGYNPAQRERIRTRRRAGEAIESGEGLDLRSLSRMGIARAAGSAERERRMIKNWEPRLTGMAYSEREVFQIEVAGKLTAEHVGRLLYLADLWLRDPDYLEHRSKRVHLVRLVRGADLALLDFARRRRSRVLVLGAGDDLGRVSESDG